MNNQDCTHMYSARATVNPRRDARPYVQQTLYLPFRSLKFWHSNFARALFQLKFEHRGASEQVVHNFKHSLRVAWHDALAYPCTKVKITIVIIHIGGYEGVSPFRTIWESICSNFDYISRFNFLIFHFATTA